MARMSWAIAPLAFAIAAAPAAAQTGFNGYYDYSTWTSTQTAGYPTFSTIDAPQQTLTLYEPDNNATYYAQEFDFSHAIDHASVVTFDWTFDASVDACCSGMNFYRNGTLYNLSGGYFGNSYNFPTYYQTGSFQISVSAGDWIAFGAFSADGCCGASSNTVTNFNVRSVPEPASWALMLGGFGLVGGALRSRRKAAVRFA
jgi:hypothetical protein